MNRVHRGFEPMVPGWLVTLGILALLLSWPIYAGASVAYAETKGPFKNWMQVVDLEGDADPDVLVSHTRWERVDTSWVGIGGWINQGRGEGPARRSQIRRGSSPIHSTTAMPGASAVRSSGSVSVGFAVFSGIVAWLAFSPVERELVTGGSVLEDAGPDVCALIQSGTGMLEAVSILLAAATGEKIPLPTLRPIREDAGSIHPGGVLTRLHPVA